MSASEPTRAEAVKLNAVHRQTSSIATGITHTWVIESKLTPLAGVAFQAVTRQCVVVMVLTRTSVKASHWLVFARTNLTLHSGESFRAFAA